MLVITTIESDMHDALYYFIIWQIKNFMETAFTQKIEITNNKLSNTLQVIVARPPPIISLPYDHPHLSSSRQFAHKNFGC